MKHLSNKRIDRDAGFTLIEIAMVLAILGLVLGGLITAIGQSTENTRRSEARALINRVEEALYGFAQVLGRLPCPASDTSNGEEDVVDINTGVCNFNGGHGFVPAVTLGLQGRVNADGLLLDPWMNPLRYSVSALNLGANRAFTSELGMQSLFAAPGILVAGPTLLRVCNAADCPTEDSVLADTVPAVVISMGPNWATFTSADEVDNAGNVTEGGYRLTNTNTFVSRDYNPATYDDIITWLSPHVLLSRQVMAGRLP
jgi:prepilin-type N-terminal cleavage/methylation domain-containing protein